jgi:hypothetical protein
MVNSNHYIADKSNTMIIVVKHSINNPQEFWASAQASLPELPIGGVQRILQVMPNADMTAATCVWEASDIDTLNTYLRSKVKDWSEESYQEVNMENAMGVPA